METLDYTSIDVINYYNECWLDRFVNGHNPTSLAMHLGYFESDINNDIAKDNTNRFLINQLQIPKDEFVKIVDLGCGVGGTCMHLAKYNKNSQIIGINISEKQIAFAKEQSTLKQCDNNIEYYIRNYANTELDESTFDFVYGIESICHAENKTHVFQEAYRLLKPGGKFAILDYFELNENIDNQTEKLLLDFRKGWAVKEYLIGAEGILENIGFANIQTKIITNYVMPGIINSYTKAIQQLLIKDINENSLMYSHLLACRALKDLVEKKVIEYKMVIAVK